MSEILNIEELRKKAATVISIPNFDNKGTIKVRVQKPRLMAMASQGRIPNHLLGVVNEMMFGKSKEKKGTKAGKETKVEDVAKVYELYCRTCLIEPDYDEFKDIITDEQMESIFSWAMGGSKELENFRTEQTNVTDNNNGKALQKETK